jgi:peptide/nickel transport system permease protein
MLIGLLFVVINLVVDLLVFRRRSAACAGRAGRHAWEATEMAEWIRRAADSDIWWSFKSSTLTVVAAVATLLIILIAVLSPLLAPHTPFDPATLNLSDGLKPPVFVGSDGDWTFPLGTDDQGRDVLSSIMYGTRLSLVVGFASVVVAMVLGIALGLISGYVGGAVDAVIMRVADVQLTFPAILVALLIDGIVRGLISVQRHDEIAIYVIVGAIGLSFWVQYARTVRGSVMVEKNKEYVQAARVIGLSPALIMVRHVLPNVTGPVLVIATLNLGLAIISERRSASSASACPRPSRRSAP